MVRYDAPALGPLSAAVSMGNGDRVSWLLKLDQEYGDTMFGAQLGYLHWTSDEPGENPTSIGASFGVTMASGITFSGAWAKGSNIGWEAGTPRQAVSTNIFLRGERNDGGNAWYYDADGARQHNAGFPTVSSDDPLIGKPRNAPNRFEVAEDWIERWNELYSGLDDENGDRNKDRFARFDNLSRDRQQQKDFLIEQLGYYDEDPVTGRRSLSDTQLAAILEGEDANSAASRYQSSLDGSRALSQTVVIQEIDATPSTDPSYLQFELGYMFGNTGRRGELV